MTSDRQTSTALHLLLVWAMMTAAVPMLGFGMLVAGWTNGVGAAVPVFLFGALLAVCLLSLAGLPVHTVVPLCGTQPKRLGWAVLVFVLGTLGVLAGLAAYGKGVDLGSAGMRYALTGVPYVVVAAFFVPSRWVRWGAVAALAAGVAYGGFVGPALSHQRHHDAEITRYKEHQELLYMGAAPPGMQVVRAQLSSASFSVEYHHVPDYEAGYAGLLVRSLLTPGARCPEPLEQGMTCTMARGEMRMVRDEPGGGHEITLTRRLRNAEAEVTSRTLDEPQLRRLLDTLHPLSDKELEGLIRDRTISAGF
ncbi:hypothetical protein AB0L85_13965 [Streptomyces sp. NPDC052051]|uniref:hypothetical protein n=1 Tax=Streptomyces sp. NPDC052051 TaxID=3154649 RepID=UPI003435974B